MGGWGIQPGPSLLTCSSPGAPQSQPTVPCPLRTHGGAEVAAARAAVVLDHAGAVGLAQDHQGHTAGWPHRLTLQDAAVAAAQLGTGWGGVSLDAWDPSHPAHTSASARPPRSCLLPTAPNHNLGWPQPYLYPIATPPLPPEVPPFIGCFLNIVPLSYAYPHLFQYLTGADSLPVSTPQETFIYIAPPPGHVHNSTDLPLPGLICIALSPDPPPQPPPHLICIAPPQSTRCSPLPLHLHSPTRPTPSAPFPPHLHIPHLQHPATLPPPGPTPTSSICTALSSTQTSTRSSTSP